MTQNTYVMAIIADPDVRECNPLRFLNFCNGECNADSAFLRNSNYPYEHQASEG
jgi:hypothetical protein